MGGKGSSTSNNQMVQMQQEQAAQARQKETERAARLKSGSDYINSLFDGTPSGAKTLDLSGLASTPANSVGGGVAGSRLGSNSKGGTYSTDGRGSYALADGYTVGQTADDGSGAGYGVYDAQGNLVSQAHTLDDLSKQKIVYGGDPNGPRTGGFGDDFYNKFRQANLDYYMPELDRQFSDAKSNLNFGLARSGQLRSSTANQSLADLTYQKDVNSAQMTAQADSATAGLRNEVQANKSAAINQLYSTEDPTLAANTATSLVKNTELTQPQLNPIGQLFAPIAIGMGAGMQGYSNAQAYGKYLPAPGAGAGATSGKNYST
jgi:hypothetical protein